MVQSFIYDYIVGSQDIIRILITNTRIFKIIIIWMCQWSA
jgi:hypothetical protein